MKSTLKSIACVSGAFIPTSLFCCLLVAGALINIHTSSDQSLSFEETLEKMMDIAGVKPGMVIGEIGSGGGPFTFRLAGRVGRNGKIYANDIDQEALDSIDEKGIRNIETVLGEIDDPVFPVKNLDMVIMRSVFHDLENPLSVLENIKKYLDPGAPCVMIEQLPLDQMPSHPIHVMTEDQILEIVDKSSFKLANIDASLPSRWIVYILEVDDGKGRNVWANWLDEFRTMVAKAYEIEEDANLSSAKKRIFWEKVWNSYRDNNPDSDDDEQLREYIYKKIGLLREMEEQSVPLAGKETPDALKPRLVSGFQLRTEYKLIDLEDISGILRRLGFKGGRFAESGDFKNQYEQLSIHGDKVVVDKTSGLMWCQGGSKEPMDFFEAQEWIDDMNTRGYAGYSDWRLPTIDEAVSLMETKKINGDMQIDLAFSRIQRFVWTGDAPYPGRMWVSLFSSSSLWEELKTNRAWVRPVRSSL